MITHYLTIALRNLFKYKTQSVFSIIGLAVGFVCFTLSTLWINYETTYDTFHPDAERLYFVSTDHEMSPGKYGMYTPSALAGHLAENWSEVEQATIYQDTKLYVQRNNRLEEIPTLGIDTTFCQMMDIQVLEGSNQFMIPREENNEVAITRKGAEQLFGTTDVIGKTITDTRYKKEYRICAIVSDWGTHTMIPYQILKARYVHTEWESGPYKTLVKLVHGTDAKAWEEKINQHFPKELRSNKFFPDTGLRRFLVTSITDVRHNKQLATFSQSPIILRYIYYFAVIGILIIVCALVNQLTLFIDRCHIRRREMALRKVHGASNASLLALLTCDFSMTLIAAFFISMMSIELLMPLFCEYTGIVSGEISVYKECMFFVMGVAFISLVAAIIVIAFFQRKSLQGIMQSNRSERIFRKVNIVLQLGVSLAFILVTVIMQKQIHHLRHSDVGFEYENRGAVSIWNNVDLNEWMEKIKALPMVTEVVEPKYWPFVSPSLMSTSSIISWDGLGKDLEQPLTIRSIDAGEDFFKFYGITALWRMGKPNYTGLSRQHYGIDSPQNGVDAGRSDRQTSVPRPPCNTHYHYRGAERLCIHLACGRHTDCDLRQHLPQPIYVERRFYPFQIPTGHMGRMPTDDRRNATNRTARQAALALQRRRRVQQIPENGRHIDRITEFRFFGLFVDCRFRHLLTNNLGLRTTPQGDSYP